MYYHILHIHVHVRIYIYKCTIIYYTYMYTYIYKCTIIYYTYMYTCIYKCTITYMYMYMYATFNVLCSLIFFTYKQYKNKNWTLRKISFKFGMCFYMQLSMCMCDYIVHAF